jgi:hypothetical protein
MPESETDNNSMVAVDNGRAGEGPTSSRATTADGIRIEEEEALPERSRVQSRMKDMLVTISSLAVPLLIVTLLLFPAIIVVVVLVGVCLVPTLLVLCVGCMLYLFCPETSSTFAVLWGSNGPQRRWDMDWTLTNYMESLEPRSREDLETSLIVKTVVEGGPLPEDDGDIEQGTGSAGEDETKVPEGQDCEKDETSITDDGEKGESDKDIEAGKAAEPKAKPPSKSKPILDFDFDPKTMIHLNEISKSCCDICMMDYELEEKISQSKHAKCDHIFHKECILDWMQKKHTCPCCRRNYLGDESNDDIVTPGWRENM